MPTSSTSSDHFQSAWGPLLKDYLAFKVGLGFTSFANSYDARNLDRHIASLALSDFGQFDQAAMLNWIHSQPDQSAGSKNGKIQFLWGFFKYVMRRGLVQQNPALSISLLKTQPNKPYIYTILEIHQIIQEAAKYKKPIGPTLSTLFFLLYACGLRISEALKLKIQDIDFGENTLSLWNTKFHKERLIPFSPAVAKKLKIYLTLCRKKRPTLRPTDPVFCLLGVKDRQSRVGDYFREIRTRCGLVSLEGGRDPRIHDLRHAFAVHRLYKWYQEGANPLNKLPLLSTYMGHVSIASTQVYLTVTLALLREGDRRFQASFEEVTSRAVQRAFKHQ